MPLSLSALAALSKPTDQEDEEALDYAGGAAGEDDDTGGAAVVPASLQGTGGAPGGSVPQPEDDVAQWLNDLRVSKLKSSGFTPADIQVANQGAAADIARAGQPIAKDPTQIEAMTEDLANRRAQSENQMAGLLNDTEDINATRAGQRAFMPDVYNWWNAQNKAALEKATAPAQVEAAGALYRQALANQGEVDKAIAAATGRFNRPPSETAKDLLQSIADLSKSGAFGMDRNGHPLAPPQGVQDQVTAALHSLITGQGPGANEGVGAAPKNGVLTDDDLNEYIKAHPGSTYSDAVTAAVRAGYKIR